MAKDISEAVIGHNGLDTEALKHHEEIIVRLKDELARSSGEINARIKAAYGDAADALGVSPKVVREAIKQKLDYLKSEERISAWSEDDQSDFSQVREGLGVQFELAL